VHFGFTLPGRGPLARPDLVVKIARNGEALGYSSLFVTDHVILPAEQRSVYPYHPSGQFPGGTQQEYLEPLTVMSYLAGETTKIRLGTSVLVIPYRNPVVTAKMLATLDVLSGGRVIVGAGVGWLEEEFVALAAPPYRERGRATDEYIRLMRECWTRAAIDFQGRYYRVRDIVFLPKPLQKAGIPIWIGGHTEAALRRAGQLGDGWHPIAMRVPALLPPSEYAEKVKQVHAWARRAGRDPRAITLTVRAPMEVLPRRAKAPAGDRLLFRGTAEQVIGDIRQYQAVGVTHFVFDPTATDAKEVLANLERFAQEVRPKVRRAP
jgi:probable F420-dependent oxidoreductase